MAFVTPSEDDRRSAGELTRQVQEATDENGIELTAVKLSEPKPASCSEPGGGRMRLRLGQPLPPAGQGL